jgi:hypothetical protein
MAAAVGAVDDQIMAVGMFVGKAACDDASDQRPGIGDGRLIDGLIGQGAGDAALRKFTLHRADDVAALTGSPQDGLEVVRQPPVAAADRFGEAQPAELGEAARAQRLVEGAARCGGDHAVTAGVAQQRPVERSQPFLVDLGALAVFNVAQRTRAQIEVDQFTGALAHAGCQIVARDHEIGAAMVRAADDDVRVRMAGVEMIDRDPVELRAEIFLDPCHQPACQGLEVVIIGAVLGRDDEAELVAVAGTARLERLAVDGIAFGAVQPARLARARCPVALQIPQVRGCPGSALAGKLDDARLDDDAARTGRRVAAALGQQPADPGAAADPAAGERLVCRTKNGRAAAREIGGREHAPEIFAGAPTARTAHAPKPRFEPIFRGHRRLSGLSR